MTAWLMRDRIDPADSRRIRAAWLGALLLALLLLCALATPQVSRAASSWWVPPRESTWQWQLTVPVDQSVDAQVYDIDLFENEASVVSSLHAQGRHVICYLDVGTWEGWRPDASKFPASVLGKADPGWTEEKWLDIRQLSIIEPIMQARLELCKQKGFDGVEADNVDGFQNNTGFPLTAAEQLTYNEWLANTAHTLGLSIALKSDTDQAAELEPYFDFSLDEECFDYSECNELEPFIKAGKPVFEVEYSLEPSQFCAQANALGFMAMKKNLELDAWNSPCWPQGNWVGAKGSAGYDLAAWDGSSDVSYMPNATATLVKGSRYAWAPQPSDTRALERPAGSGRAAAAYYDPSQIEVQLHFSAAYQGNLHLYAVDWDSTARRETITADGQSANLTAGNFNQGAWVSFPIDVAAGATVPITVTRTAGANAVLSGIMLGDAGAPPAPTVTSAPQGAWTSAVGSAGYDLAGWDGSTGDVSYLPHASLSLVQGSRYQWTAGSSDARALSDPTGATRNVGTYYDPSQIQVKLSFATAYSGNLHLYAVDWDHGARRESITVNGQTAVLGEFGEGAWVTLPISVAAGGVVTITVDRIAGANAVLSGIFLGDAGAPPAAPVSSAPQGSWVGVHGSTGYDLLAFNGSSDLASLPNASLTVNRGSRYQWASSTTDVRALESQDKSARVAATYYDSSQIELQLGFTAAYSGNLELYAIDWDSTTRREMVSVNGQTAVLSSAFNAGAWTSFPISVQAGGTVTITVDRLAGPNAVLSGIFLG
jgi:hypothetical protein